MRSAIAGAGGMLESSIEIELGMSPRGMGAGSLSPGCVGCGVMGRRFGSGLTTMWVGSPPCDTIVGGTELGGRGTKV